MTERIDADRLYARVWQLRREGNLPEGRAVTVDALAQLRQDGDTKSLGRAVCVMGQIERDERHNDKAADCYAEAADLYRQAGDRPGLAYALRHQGDILRELGRLPEADRALEEALALYRSLNSTPLDLADILRVCALAKEDLGKTSEARALWTEARDRYVAARELRDSPGGNPGVAEADRRLAGLD